jgi:hypothetical protein
MPTWPASLPQKPKSGTWRRAPQDNRLTFQPAAGPPIVRRRSSVKVFMASGQFDMSQTQVATFEAFYQEDLKDGSLSFDWTDPEAGGAATWRIRSYEIADLAVDERRVSIEFTRLP